jgi:hypothetical protein
LLGRKNKKIEFDARNPPQQLLNAPQSYSFVHNFKVHFKSSGLQMLANKIDVSVNTDSATLPSPQLVTSEFNNRMVMANAHSNTRARFNSSSFHITNIEYKESIAMIYEYGNAASQDWNQVPVAVSAPQPQQQQNSNQGFMFCRNCGNKLPSESKFCNSCGNRIQ